jgi:aminoglycoside phosphotransferase (APT) family kinase protein
MVSAQDPEIEVAQRIAATFCNSDVVSVRQFPTGLCHFVFEASVPGGRRFVVRIARPENGRLLTGAVYWEKQLRTAGIPIARILHADLERQQFPFAYLILERLDGTDLEAVYPLLSRESKVRLGGRMAELQCAVAELRHGPCFGNVISYEDPNHCAFWRDVVEANIAACSGRIQDGSVLTLGDVAALERAASSLSVEFARVEDRAFLDDATTKNVIVTAGGQLSGIVDVDTVCFGDNLFPLALTRAACTKLGYDSVYTDAWSESLRPDDEARRRLSFYTALFAAVLLSEHGHRFNRDSAVEIDRAQIGRLRELFVAALQ